MVITWYARLVSLEDLRNSSSWAPTATMENLRVYGVQSMFMQIISVAGRGGWRS